jgi:hypothetical protein
MGVFEVLCGQNILVEVLSLKELDRRIEDAIGRIGLELDEVEELQRCLIPEWYEDEGLPDSPTAEMPGTIAKMQSAQGRAFARQALFHPGDADDPLDRGYLPGERAETSQRRAVRQAGREHRRLVPNGEIVHLQGQGNQAEPLLPPRPQPAAELAVVALATALGSLLAWTANAAVRAAVTSEIVTGSLWFAPQQSLLEVTFRGGQTQLVKLGEP